MDHGVYTPHDMADPYVTSHNGLVVDLTPHKHQHFTYHGLKVNAPSGLDRHDTTCCASPSSVDVLYNVAI